MADSSEIDFGYANRRVSSIDEGNIYRGKQMIALFTYTSIQAAMPLSAWAHVWMMHA